MRAVTIIVDWLGGIIEKVGKEIGTYPYFIIYEYLNNYEHG